MRIKYNAKNMGVNILDSDVTTTTNTTYLYQYHYYYILLILVVVYGTTSEKNIILISMTSSTMVNLLVRIILGDSFLYIYHYLLVHFLTCMWCVETK